MIIEITSSQNLNPAQIATYFSFLKEQLQLGHFFFKNATTAVNWNSHLIFFHQSVLIRPNEAEGNYYHDYIGIKIGRGGFGVVYDIAKTVKISELEFKQYRPTVPQLIKVQALCSCTPEAPVETKHLHNTASMIENEYQLSQQIPHLNVRQPIYHRSSRLIFMIMDKLAENDLQNILYRKMLRNGIKQRLQLIQLLLHAVKSQVTDLGLIHRDLKPENILVILEPMTVYIIDYASAKKIPSSVAGVLAPPRLMTTNYLAPEMLSAFRTAPTQHFVQTPRIDVFATGRIIREILENTHCCDASYKAHYSKDLYQEYLTEDLLKFDALNEPLKQLTLTQQAAIKSLLTKMLVLNPEERISIDTAIAEFEVVYQEITTPELFTSLPVSVNPPLSPQRSFQLISTVPSHLSGLVATSRAGFFANAAPNLPTTTTATASSPTRLEEEGAQYPH